MGDASTSTIGPGTLVRGSLKGDSDLEIHGRVEGSVIVTGELTIAETAQIRSDASGRRVVVRGAVLGNISALEAIILESGARVVGDLGAPQIGIRQGALVRGNVKTGAPLVLGAPAAAAATKGRPTPAQATRAGSPSPARAQGGRGGQAQVAAAAVARVAAPTAPTPRPSAPTRAIVQADEAAAPAVSAEPEAKDEGGPPDREGPPPPIVPALPKGAKAQLRRKGAR